jgi:hypothetical protein
MSRKTQLTRPSGWRQFTVLRRESDALDFAQLYRQTVGVALA